MEQHETQHQPSFRDQLGIVSKEGKRKWIYPREPSGPFHRARLVISWILLAILFGVPFLRVDGHPLMLFDITERTFILFGWIFGPHDFFLLALTMITVIVSIFLFTVVYGRLFCGWICPQTIFMELVFRKIDYWIEGNHREQRALNESSMNGTRTRKKLLKHAIYFALSFIIANMLLAWVIGTDKLSRIMTDPPLEHLGGLTAILAFTATFHWIFAWFREQACILVCPYGRLQGVLLDRHSTVIAYDYLRGEPRGKFRKSEPRQSGDCIDCHQCVEVCPTGIDIRNGTQLECVNCTACIDACNTIMESIDRPRGLIRYDSIEGIEKKVRSMITMRSAGYSIVLIVLIATLGYFLFNRTQIDVTILRTPGMFFQEQPDNRVSNLYEVKAMNKTFEEFPLAFKLKTMEGSISVLGEHITLKPQETASARLFVVLHRNQLRAMSTPIEIEVFRGGDLVNVVQTTFLGPVQKKEPAQ